jgi:hypothetical protein
MGLMLATMLPKDEATLIAVYDAIGVEFINRLLLTLRSENKQVSPSSSQTILHTSATSVIIISFERSEIQPNDQTSEHMQTQLCAEGEVMTLHSKTI